MKSNKKGTLVFLRTFEAETRNAIVSLHDSITKDLKESKTDTVTTLIAHIYPKVTFDSESHGIFGHVKPYQVAATVLDGVAKNRSVVYMPEYSMFFAFWLKFMPSAFVELIDGVLFDDKKK